jgi:hypothetical protein
VAETQDKVTQDKQPEALQRASSRVPAMIASLAVLAVIGAATAYALPHLTAYTLTDFKIFADQSPPHEVASAPIPDRAVNTALKDIQMSQRQNAAVLLQNAGVLEQNAAMLERLMMNSIAQQADLKRISDQLSSLVTRTDALQKAGAPVTPVTTSAIQKPNARSRVVRTSRKEPSRLPKPAGPVSVGGAPLNPVLASRSGAG